jgi:hypothetical protein
VKHGKYIHNINEKRARLACSAGKEIIVSIGIKEMYIEVPENRFFLTIMKSVSADGKVILLIIIVLKLKIMMNWFYENMTKHKVITVSPTEYTNKKICIAWLDYFIKYNNCELN